MQTATEFVKLLQKAHPEVNFPNRGTIRGWFVFKGRGSSGGFPQLTDTWEQNYASRRNVRLRRSTGPKPKLLGCESTLSRTEEHIRCLCGQAVPVNAYTARSILLAHLVADNHEDFLSPHLLSPRRSGCGASGQAVLCSQTRRI